MLSRIFQNSTFSGLEKSMEASKMRDNVTSHNIANATTPHFKRSYVEFEQYMAAAMLPQDEGDFEMRRTRTGHVLEEEMSMADIKPTVMTDESTTLRMDGNNVDIEHEMAEYAKNEVHYKALVEQMNSEFRRLRTAIGRG